MKKPILQGLKTSNFFISLIVLLLSAQPLFSQVQPANKRPAGKADSKKKDENKVVFPLYNGVYVGADLFGLGNSLLGGDFISSEVSIDVNLKNKFFPVVEVGYGKADKWQDDGGIHYKSSAP